MNLDNMTARDLDLLALAMDYLLCNGDLSPAVSRDVEELFYLLDVMAEEAQEETSRLIEQQDNLLVVDFSPKAG